MDVDFIKGVDKYNMPRPGDVMVTVPQIMEAAVEVLNATCGVREKSYSGADRG